VLAPGTNGASVEIIETVVIDAPIARVWALTLDLEALPSITPTITEVALVDPPPVQVGTRARLTQPGLARRTWTVEEIDEPRRFAWATRVAGVRLVGVHELERLDEDRCRLTLRVVLEGTGSGLLGRLGRRSLSRALRAEAAGFARAAAVTNA
jgi:uncharacterized membrane protein